MALANFFERAAVAASQVLKGFDSAAFAEKLNAHVVGLAFDAAAAGSPEGRATLELSANLLSRLSPRIALVPREGVAPEVADSLVAAARAINPDVEITSDLGGVAVCLAVGTTTVTANAPVVYVGSDGWVVRLSPDSPVGSGATSNPFGAGAAACFGTANVFRILFAGDLPHGNPDAAFTLSLLDTEPNAPSPANLPLEAVDLGESHLVGVGAIGNGVVWALGKLSQLRGTLHLVDHEAVDLSNLQRYVLTTQADIETPKATLGVKALSNTGLAVQPHQRRWGEYLRERGNCVLQRVAVAVDSAQDRRAVQASLPRWVVNAWTQTGDLGVSRHAFLGDQACLMCLYLPDDKQKDEDELVAEAIGLPEARLEVRELLYKGTPVGRPLLERIATALHVPTAPLLAFEGEPLRSFYAKAICGGIVLRLGGGNGQVQNAEVPMAFQSALAGILLAAELLAHAGGLKQAPPPVSTKINLLRPLAPYLSFPATKHHPSARCICQDPDYVAAYRAKYDAPANA